LFKDFKIKKTALIVSNRNRLKKVTLFLTFFVSIKMLRLICCMSLKLD